MKKLLFKISVLPLFALWCNTVSAQQTHTGEHTKDKNYTVLAQDSTWKSNKDSGVVNLALTQLYRTLYINGVNSRSNNIVVDRSTLIDPFGYTPAMWSIVDQAGVTSGPPIPMGAVKHLSLLGNPFDVQFGNFTGSNIILETRKGSNTVSGSVYGLGRFGAIAGNDRIGAQGKMPSQFHNYTAGISLGFPILKDKVYFYTSEEFVNERVPVQQVAGSNPVKDVLSLDDAQKIRNFTMQKYGWDPGTFDQYNASVKSGKFFNRIDWLINAKNELSIRNATTISKGTNFQRDQQFFRFGSFAYEQKNTISQTTLELKSILNPSVTNSFTAGYTYFSQLRNPLSNPSLPQIQIGGRTPGTAIFLGTDRDAAIFKQKTNIYEINDKLTYRIAKHEFGFGVYATMHHVASAYVNSWNGRLEYLSIEDYTNGIPYQVRGNYNYIDNSRDYILSHPDAKFNMGQAALYASDKIQLSNKLEMTFGLRADYTHLFDRPSTSDRVKNAYTDPYFNNTFNYTPLSRIDNHFLRYFQLSPRIGFVWDANGNQRLVLRGGVGLFSGRLPLAWLANAYTNNGDRYGNFDQKYSSGTFVSDPVIPGQNGISDFIAKNKVDIHDKSAGRSEVNVVDNNFKLPKAVKLNLQLDYTTTDQYFFSIQAQYSKAIREVVFKNINFVDNPTYFGNDKDHQQPIFSNAVDPRLNNVFEMSTINKGYQYSLTGLTSHNFASGFNYLVAYTYGKNKNIADYPGNSMENVWQSNPLSNPNNPEIGYSNLDIRHRIFGNIGYQKQWDARWKSNFGLQVRSQSGVPFTYGFLINGIQGTEQTVSLAYIPNKEEAIRFFQDVTQNGATIISASQQAAQFNSYIDGNKYLQSRRGKYTERNGARTPWSTQVDFHFAQEFHFSKTNKEQYVSVVIDIFNLTNLLNKDWGKVYYAPGAFNGTASVGLLPGLVPSAQNPGNYPVYKFNNPTTPYTIDYLRSRVQGQIGVQYNF